MDITEDLLAFCLLAEGVSLMVTKKSCLTLWFQASHHTIREKSRLVSQMPPRGAKSLMFPPAPVRVDISHASKAGDRLQVHF